MDTPAATEADRFPDYSSPPRDECVTDRNLPATADVVVIGGGIIGVSTAMFLAERGVSVVLCEKGAIAAEQSSRNWGWVRKMGRDPRELPLMIEAMHIWEQMTSRIGSRLGFHRSGILYLCDSEADLSRRAAWLECAKAFQLDSHLIGADEVRNLLPGAQGQWLGALYTPSDGRAEPQNAVPLFAHRARELGAILIENCAVRGIETQAGRVRWAITERGAIACEAVVLAGGAWSRLFCRNLNVDIPQLKALSSVMHLDGVRDGPSPAALGGSFAFRRRADDGYTVANSTAAIADIVPDSFRLLPAFLPILRAEWGHTKLRLGRRFVEEYRLPNRWSLDRPSPFEQVRVLDPRPAYKQLDAAIRALQIAFPAFKTAAVRRCWAGLIDVTPDALPVISSFEPLPGFFIATGFSGHGFGIGPGAGHLMADLVMGRPSIVDPTPFRLSRFSDGSRLSLFTGL